MRNLILLGRERLEPSRSGSSSSQGAAIQAVAINPLTNDIYAASVASAKAGPSSSGTAKIIISHLLPATESDDEQAGAELAFAPSTFEVIADPCSFAAPSEGSSSRRPPRSSKLYSTDGVSPEVVLLHYLNDGGSISNGNPGLCLVTAGGDILVGEVPDAGHGAPSQLSLEVVGSIEQGIYAAQWSPDEEVLAVITAPTWLEAEQRWEGEKLLIMTKEFEVLSESILATDEFGEGEHDRMSLSRSQSSDLPCSHSPTS